MTKRIICITMILLALSVCANAASYMYTARDTAGNLTANYSEIPALAASSGNSAAKGQVGGQRYGSTYTSIVGSKAATWTTAALAAGYYDIYTTWGSGNNRKTVPYNIDGGAAIMVDQNATLNVWVALGTRDLSAGTHTVRISNDAVNVSGSFYADAVKFDSSVSDAVVYGTGNGIEIDLTQWNEFSWTAGAKTSFFNIYLGQTSGALTQVESGLGIVANTLDMSNYGLVAGSTYYWRVDDGNLDNITAGTEMMFTTKAVPEPSSMLAFATGLIGLFGIIRRKKA